MWVEVALTEHFAAAMEMHRLSSALINRKLPPGVSKRRAGFWVPGVGPARGSGEVILKLFSRYLGQCLLIWAYTA